jgi:nanoRNase/pAp phosphatase (c-di-AMP/oligoRNAs hydrolase)
MTSFVESCIETVSDSAHAVERRSRGRPRAAKLVKQLSGKRRILVTTHIHPDPDALASAQGLTALLKAKLPNAKVEMAIKGKIAGGINTAFAKHAGLDLVEWDESLMTSGEDAGGGYDAIVLLDCQPAFSYNPVPESVTITSVIDHHRSVKGKKPHCGFCDVRTDVGATSSIVFSYFMELEVPIPPLLGASLLYAIESDLAGAAGTPGELDNIALAGLTLIADAKTLYKMRYVKLSQSYYAVFAEGLASAVVYDSAVVSHLTEIDSLEKPAVLADTLLRYDKAEWSMVTARHDGRVVVSLRTSGGSPAAADVMQKLMRGLGEGGGHRAKAGGSVKLSSTSDEDQLREVERVRTKLRQRLVRAVGMGKARGMRLIPGK